MKQEILEQLFTYHPPKNEEQQELHNIINEASLMYASFLAGVIKNPTELTTILREIQKVKMMANQAVTYERLGISIRDLFSE